MAGAVMLLKSTVFIPAWRFPMTSSRPTMIVTQYHLRPNQQDCWLETWRQLAVIAKSMQACRTFALELDRAAPDRATVISTWSSGAAFDQFVREVGLIWMERHLDYSHLPPRYTRFPLPASEPVKRADGQLTGAGA
jgi:quinol monooxygenase YgiN